MIPEHRSEETEPGARGEAFGVACADPVRRTLAAYEQLFAATRGFDGTDIEQAGRQVGERVGAAAPELVEEIEGIAAGAGVPAQRLLAVNARTEILAGETPPECSTIGVTAARSSAGPLLAQNWDWHPTLAGSLVLWTVCPPGGPGFTTLTEAGILAKVGCNDRGLALALNILGSSLDGGLDGMPIHLLLRLIVECCDGIEQVEGILAENRVAASSAMTVCVGDSLCCFEVSPAGAVRVDPRDGLLLHTNHFLGLPAEATDVYRHDWPDTVPRLEDLRSRLEGRDEIAPANIAAALRSHAAGAISVCCHDAENPRYADRQETLASVLFRPAARRIAITVGPPCRTRDGIDAHRLEAVSGCH